MDGVVVGVDESVGAAVALRWGVAHAESHHRPVTALMAWSFRDQHSPDASAPFKLDYGRADATRDLDVIVTRALGASHPEVRRREVSGTPASELLKASHGADLLVVGARGAGGFKGLLLGSVSREVAARATSPVAIVRRAREGSAGPIVVGVDGSDIARVALRWAIAEGRVRDRPVVAVWSWHVSTPGLYDGAVPVDPSALEQATACAREPEIAPCALGDRIVEPRVVEGLPAAVLVEASRSASMVVVGTRGRRPLAGLLLGSVSDAVARHAACPVVVVPPTAMPPLASAATPSVEASG